MTLSFLMFDYESVVNLFFFLIAAALLYFVFVHRTYIQRCV